MKRVIFRSFMVAAVLLVFAGVSWAGLSAEELAAESEAYTASTAKSTPTNPAAIMARVNEACALLSREGSVAFSKFKGKASPFLYEGTYIWVHSFPDGTMLMHPIKHKMEGRHLIGLKDEQGKRFFVTMNNVAAEKGEGWVDYLWPEPGFSEAVRKISFVKKCIMADGNEVVIGSGIYNGDQTELAKLEIH